MQYLEFCGIPEYLQSGQVFILIPKLSGDNMGNNESLCDQEFPFDNLDMNGSTQKTMILCYILNRRFLLDLLICAHSDTIENK